MRTPPALRMAARKVAMNGSKPLSINACGESAVRPQSWPRELKRSGGAPILSPSSRSLGRDHAWLPHGFMPTARSEISPMRMPPSRAVFCTFRKAAIREPLHEDMQTNCGPVLTRKMFHPRPVGMALIGRPINAAPFPALAIPLLMQGFEQRVLAQPLAALALERQEIRCQGVARLRQLFRGEILVQATQQCVFCRSYVPPLDQGIRRRRSVGPRRCDALCAEDGSRIGIERIEI